MEKAKGKKFSSLHKCVIHDIKAKVHKESPLIKPQDYDSWLTLLNAAKTRQYAPLLNIARLQEETTIPEIVYHRECRQKFTLRRDLDNLKRKAEESPDDGAVPGGSEIKRTRRTSSESRIYEKKCMFSPKYCSGTKFMKEVKTREPLIKARQLRVDEKLRAVAISKGDLDIIALTSRDIVAAEAHYHRSCYRSYTKCEKELEVNVETDNVGPDDIYKQRENEAYEELFNYIRTETIANKEIIQVKELTRKLETFMKSNGVQEVTDATKNHIRRKLEQEFQESLHIIKDNSGRLLAVPDSITFRDVVCENQIMKTDLAVLNSKNKSINTAIDRASLYLRSVIKKDKKDSPWPVHPSYVDSDSHNDVPEHLDRFLLGILTGEPDHKNPSTRVTILKQSFSQDLIYAVTNGQQKTPKHILLPYAVKTLTGNVEIIKILNRLGHGVSYSQLEENDTALCLQKLAATPNRQVVLPSNIQPHIFTNLAWDNIDRLEETLTGKGTSHRINGIAVQSKIFGPNLPTVSLPKIEKLKQRTVSTENDELPVYIAGARVGPIPQHTTVASYEEDKLEIELARKKNLIWCIARQANTEKQIVPSWTGFNIRTRDSVEVSQSNIGYLPTINAPATELTTVQEILTQSELIRETLKLNSIVVVMDQALYAKAAEIAWKHTDKYKHIILRLGTFHTICNAMSILGARFQDAGLRDLCIEGGLIAEGSVTRVLEGKMYNRAVRIHKLVYEALMRLAWMEFILWVESSTDEISRQVVDSCLMKSKELVENLCQEKFEDTLQLSDIDKLQTLWKRFLEYLRQDNGKMSAFWMSYIDMVEGVLLALLRGAREGNWNLHLSAIRSMIPWCFAYDKVNYARYLPAYYTEMMKLPTEHPQVHQSFMDGNFSVQLSTNNTFGRIPVDQTIEVTVNKDTQTPGGTSHFSLKSAAVKRYYITAEHRSAFLGQMRDMIQSDRLDLHHTELQHSRIERDEEDVSAVVNVLQGWVNPFSGSQDIISLSTARVAPTELSSDLMKAHDTGEANYLQFKMERLESNPPLKKFHDPMKMNKLKTFSNLCKKSMVKSNGRAVILKADRALFGRIIVMAQNRDIQMADVLAHPMGPLPWALSTPEGSLRKTNKAALGTLLQRNVAPAEETPISSATVIDGMSLIQKLRGEQANFGEVAKSVFSMALREGQSSKRVDIVFDTYQDVSIKNLEREARGEETGPQLQNITAKQIVRQWIKFLTNSSNKTSLISFLVNEWKKPEYTVLLNEKILFATDGEMCFRITKDFTEEVPDLQSTHEEADGRMLLHAAHAAEDGYQSVIICTEDTDVFIMCMAFHQQIKVPLFQKCGTKARKRLVDIGKVAAATGIPNCKALIGMHAYTGCDSVSTFAGKGKVSAFKLLSSNKEAQEAFMQLGEDWDVCEELMERLEKITCLLYAAKSGTEKVNELRYHMFCAKKGEIESHQLPPCIDSLRKHAQRANYQAAIWRRCLRQDPETPSPVGKGWKMEKVDENVKLVVDWMDGQPAPQAVLDLLACTCPRICKLPKCPCMVNGMRCTDMCKLQDCDNKETIYDSSSEDEAEDDNST